MDTLFSPASASMTLLQANQGNNSAMEAAIKAQNSKHAATKNIEKIEETAQEFEAVFVSEMMKPMFEGIKTDGMFGGGKGEEVFRGMLLQEYGKLIADTGSIGLSDSIKTEMIKMQEQASN